LDDQTGRQKCLEEAFMHISPTITLEIAKFLRTAVEKNFSTETDKEKKYSKDMVELFFQKSFISFNEYLFLETILEFFIDEVVDLLRPSPSSFLKGETKLLAALELWDDSLLNNLPDRRTNIHLTDVLESDSDFECLLHRENFQTLLLEEGSGAVRSVNASLRLADAEYTTYCTSLLNLLPIQVFRFF
jgi:hypothetical protein